ncbi:hypothetical protein RUMLAC_00015 [[Ruminococcus] lactaris ATCC 29176]|uniref:Uncharacterized protein n=1 Tax=[Ruminococcus] lactaris ATCC 29176 TaxID=471875 RepID=B5CKQ1_9FIRM|nr:hypothetical protein RUMLAC_00015 [[Ruminococcus] lactaris ATCC 29176]
MLYCSDRKSTDTSICENVYFLTSDFFMLSRCFNHWKNGCFVILWISKEKSEHFTGKYTFM